MFYKNWSWIGTDCDNSTFTAMNDKLNEDCVREVINKLDYLHLIYLSRMDEKIKVLANLSRCYVNPPTVGTINLMNFRFILEMFSISELSVSLHAFDSTFGAYFDHYKKNILSTILCCNNRMRLNKVYLYDFDYAKTNKNDFEYFVKEFQLQGMELIERK